MSISSNGAEAGEAGAAAEAEHGPSLTPREAPLVYSVSAVEAEGSLVIRAWRADALLQKADYRYGEFTITGFTGPYPWPAQVASRDTDWMDIFDEDTLYDLCNFDSLARGSLPRPSPVPGPNWPSLADREPTLAYRIRLVEADDDDGDDFVLIEARHAGPALQGDGDLIGTGTLTDFLAFSPPLQNLTSKDTDLINALPYHVRDAVFQMDDWARARLNPTAGQHAPHRALARREPTLIYRIAPVEGMGTVLISVVPENASPKDLIPMGSVFIGGSGPYPRYQLLTSKDTRRIGALPEEVRSALLDMDTAVRARLKATTRQNAMRRLHRKFKTGPAAQQQDWPADHRVLSTRIC